MALHVIIASTQNRLAAASYQDAVIASAEEEDEVEEAGMAAYQPKTAAQLKPKNDAAHKADRMAYKKRTSAEKAADRKAAIAYYRKNKANILKRRAIHDKKTHK